MLRTFILCVCLLTACSKEDPSSPSTPPATSETPKTEPRANPSTDGGGRIDRIVADLQPEPWDPRRAVGTWTAKIQRARIGDLAAPPPEQDTFTFVIDEQLRLDSQAPLKAEGRTLVAEREGVTMRLTWIDGTFAGEMIRKDVAVEFVAEKK
jgi:hypothetical protein